MIAGIVLTGGRSQRMGRPKASLHIDDETFLQRAVRTLAAGGCSEVIVVLNPDEQATAELVPESNARSTWGGGAGTQQIDSFQARGAPIVRPICQGRHGHPVVFAASLFSELLDDDLPEGARTVVHRYASQSESVEVDDPGVLADVDTPEDYQQHIGDLP